MSGKNKPCRSTAPGIVPLVLVLAGCAVRPDFVPPAAPAVSHYTQDVLPSAGFTADGQSQRVVAAERIAADWWRLFNSGVLDDAVRQAIAGNASLQSAQASLRQSQAELQAGYGVFYPQIDLSAGATRQRTSPLRLGFNGAASLLNLYTLNAAVGYTLDLFGGQQRTVEALAAQRDLQRYMLQASTLALTGNIVNTMIARAAYQAQLEATRHVIAGQQAQLGIAQARASAGTATYSGVLSIRGALAANQANLPSLQQKHDQAQHLLASLLGRAPAQGSPPAIDLEKLALPAELPLSLPSVLVQQRPDILAAEAQLHVASAGIGAATAALFPRFNLNGSYGGNSTTIGAVGDAASRFWNVGPTIDLPLLQGGAAWYRRRAAIEGYQKAQADYRQTVLGAFVQVADTLKALEHDAQSLQAQHEAMDAARQALALVGANYRAGIAGYLELLGADVQYYQSRINYLQASAQRYQDTAALYVALGGGWWELDSVK